MCECELIWVKLYGITLLLLVAYNIYIRTDGKNTSARLHFLVLDDANLLLI